MTQTTDSRVLARVDKSRATRSESAVNKVGPRETLLVLLHRPGAKYFWRRRVVVEVLFKSTRSEFSTLGPRRF